MKRLFAALALLVVTTMTPAAAYAVNVTPNCTDPAMAKTDVCQEISHQPKGNNPVIDIVKAAISIVSYVIGAAAVIGIIISGLRMMLANGDSSAIATARSSLIYCIVGIIVAVSAQAIVVFVINKL